MVQKRETKAINKLCVREILRLSFVCGADFFEFRGRNLDCFGIAYTFNGKFEPEAGKARMRTAFFTRVLDYQPLFGKGARAPPPTRESSGIEPSTVGT